ncbi:MAG: GWxTD domain-containing protein [Thermoanaerobaculia bacterium]
MTCSGVRNLSLLLTLALLAACAGTPTPNATDLTNPFLGPEYTGWLIGPIARLATPEEIKAFQAITTDEQAQAFVEAFWAKRTGSADQFGNTVRQVFDKRSAEADRAFTESGYSGRRTDRGAIFILYGPPKKVDYEVSPTPGENPVEVWMYDETSPLGLDGRKPAGLYRFIKRGDLTVTYTPGRPDPRLRHRPGMPPQDPIQ